MMPSERCHLPLFVDASTWLKRKQMCVRLSSTSTNEADMIDDNGNEANYDGDNINSNDDEVIMKVILMLMS